MEFVYILIGIVIGLCIAVGYIAYNLMGVICVDQSDPSEAPYLFLEFTDPMAVASVMKKKRVIFTVKIQDYVSQK